MYDYSGKCGVEGYHNCVSQKKENQPMKALLLMKIGSENYNMNLWTCIWIVIYPYDGSTKGYIFISFAWIYHK